MPRAQMLNLLIWLINYLIRNKGAMAGRQYLPDVSGKKEPGKIAQKLMSHYLNMRVGDEGMMKCLGSS